MVTMTGGGLRDTLSGLFAVFAASDGYLEPGIFVDLFNTLAYLDEGTNISETLRAEVESSFKDLPPITLDAVLTHPALVQSA